MRVLLGNAHLSGLRLMESCRLTRDIRYQTNRERDLPRFGTLDEVKPLLPGCLILIIESISGYNRLADRLWWSHREARVLSSRSDLVVVLRA
jgi:hypothetical protein